MLKKEIGSVTGFRDSGSPGSTMMCMRHVAVDLNQERSATLEAVLFHVPSVKEQPTPLEHPRPAVIIAPGGGYMMLSQRESDPVALLLSS